MTVRRLSNLRRDPWIAPPPPSRHPLHRWLTDRSSLTARIASRCDLLTVSVLSQKLAMPHRDEARLAGLRRGELAWLREVVLIADNRPVVYARSVLARRNLRGPWTMFAGIGNQPLGAALFADPRIKRGPLTAHRLDARDRRYHRAVAAAASPQASRVWSRRSCFMRMGRGLIVCEVFLADMSALREVRET